MTPVSRLTRALIVALAGCFALAAAAHAGEPAADDPAAQAAAYSKQAGELRADADRHAQIARMHRAGAGSPKISHDSIAAHCERLAENLRAAADESESIATVYRALAEKK